MKKLLVILAFAACSLWILTIPSRAELGSSANTLFLWHFDSTQTQSDYAKAVSGPLNAILGTRSFATDTVKFGSGSYPQDGSGGSVFSMYTNGQWVLNPHEGTIDYWMYYTTDWPDDHYGIGPGMSNYPVQRIWIETQRSFSAGTSGGMQVRLDSNSSTSFTVGAGYTAITAVAHLGTWNHFAWTWSSLSNSSYIYCNGFVIGSTVNVGTTLTMVSSATYTSPDAQWQASTWYVQGYDGNLVGYGLTGARMDELRISDIDRYGGQNFTPPSTPYTTPALISLLPSGTVVLRPGRTQQFTVSGGSGSYTWSLSTSILGTLNQTTGSQVTFSAGSTGGILTINVTDGSTLASATIVINPTSTSLVSDNEFSIISRKEIIENEEVLEK